MNDSMRSEWNCKDRDEIVLERERKDLDQGLLAKECRIQVMEIPIPDIIMLMIPNPGIIKM